MWLKVIYIAVKIMVETYLYCGKDEQMNLKHCGQGRRFDFDIGEDNSVPTPHGSNILITH